MPKYLKIFLARGGYMAPADGDGNDLGGDRGDDYVSPLNGAGKDVGDKVEETAEEKEAREAAETAEKTKGGKTDDEETDEEKAEREAAEAEAAKRARIRIPKARFDEAQAKARQREQALQDEIAALKAGKQSSETQKSVSEQRAKIDELQDKYEDLILDGKKDEARKVRKQVEAMRDELVEYQTSVKSDAARAAAVEELTYDSKLAGFEAAYPAMNPDHDEFDEEKVTEMSTLLVAFTKSGMKRADALSKAVKYVLGNPPAAAGKDDDKTATDAAKARAAEARRKAAEADKKQPPASGKIGLDSDKGGKGGELGVDVMKLNQEKFAKLDEETMAKLRGDAV